MVVETLCFLPGLPPRAVEALYSNTPLVVVELQDPWHLSDGGRVASRLDPLYSWRVYPLCYTPGYKYYICRQIPHVALQGVW